MCEWHTLLHNSNDHSCYHCSMCELSKFVSWVATIDINNVIVAKFVNEACYPIKLQSFPIDE
jgi:hypothetical protein